MTFEWDDFNGFSERQWHGPLILNHTDSSQFQNSLLDLTSWNRFDEIRWSIRIVIYHCRSITDEIPITVIGDFMEFHQI